MARATHGLEPDQAHHFSKPAGRACEQAQPILGSNLYIILYYINIVIIVIYLFIYIYQLMIAELLSLVLIII